MRVWIFLTAAALLAGCAPTTPPPAAVSSAPRAARPAPVGTPIPGLPSGAKVAVFPDSSLDEMASRLMDHAEACWAGPGRLFAKVEFSPYGLVGRDGAGAEAMRVTWAAIGARYAGAAFSGPAFTEDIELEAADAARGQSRCAQAAPAAPLA